MADYQAALRSIELRHAGADPAASRSVEFTVSDGDDDSAAASKSIEIVEPIPQGAASGRRRRR